MKIKFFSFLFTIILLVASSAKGEFQSFQSELLNSKPVSFEPTFYKDIPNFTDAQKHQYQKFFRNHIKRTKDQKEELALLYHELNYDLSENLPDPAKLDNILDRIAKLESIILKSEYLFQQQFRNLLTKQQIKVLDEHLTTRIDTAFYQTIPSNL